MITFRGDCVSNCQEVGYKEVNEFLDRLEEESSIASLHDAKSREMSHKEHKELRIANLQITRDKMKRFEKKFWLARLPPLKFNDAIMRYGYTKAKLNAQHLKKMFEDLG
jgi:hypothetical protein